MTYKILIADDTKINLNVLKTILQKHNYFVDTVTNGEELIEKFEEDKYDLMFLDIQMPNLKGDDALLKIREKHNKLPYTVAISAVEFPDEIENYDKIGFDYFMPKPINENKVKLVLNKYLETIQ